MIFCCTCSNIRTVGLVCEAINCNNRCWLVGWYSVLFFLDCFSQHCGYSIARVSGYLTITVLKINIKLIYNLREIMIIRIVYLLNDSSLLCSAQLRWIQFKKRNYSETDISASFITQKYKTITKITIFRELSL